MTRYLVDITYKEYGEDEDGFSIHIDAESEEEALEKAAALAEDAYGDRFISADYAKAVSKQ